MPDIAIPGTTGTVQQVRERVEHEGTVRLNKLVEEIDATRADIYLAVMWLVEDHDAAIFPVGDVVEVRDESD